MLERQESGKNLREAVEALAADWRSLPHDPDSVAPTVLRHCGAQLTSALADHPVEPAPVWQPSDAAVEAGVRAAFERKYGLGWDAKWIDEARRARAKAEIRADVTPALEAAYRVDAPRPLLDREAVIRALRSNLTVNEYNEPSAAGTTAAVDAVMELARPMPTREQIAEALARVTHERQAQMIDGHIEDDADAGAEAVLALLNGAES